MQSYQNNYRLQIQHGIDQMQKRSHEPVNQITTKDTHPSCKEDLKVTEKNYVQVTDLITTKFSEIYNAQHV